MSSSLYRNLEWLPQAPSDFVRQCRALIDSHAELGARSRSLATHALDSNQLHKLAKVIAHARETGLSLAPLTPFKLGVVSNGTVDALLPALTASAARQGIALACVSSPFGQPMQDALSPDSAIHRARPDAVLFVLDYRGLPLQSTPGNAGAAAASIRAAIHQLQTMRGGIRANSEAVCIFQTLAAPSETEFGSLDRGLPGALRNLIDGANREMVLALADGSDVVLDVASVAETIGLADWHCPREWNLGKFPMSDAAVPLYADHVARTLGALRGTSRRCLVLDLDNTLWGGVIGDDGLEGIRVGQGDATGEAHLAVQQMALQLRARGIVLAVSSKNDDATARGPFRSHPEMLLREEHFAVFKANWNDKAANLQAIADELSLGLESLVFLDDNPAERELIRQQLPLVAVPELPEDPAFFARTLSAAGYFESVAFLPEDAQRAEFYAGNARRAASHEALPTGASDLHAYLVSLQMEITFQPFDEIGRARIVQLINKSNQFNLTTRRYTDGEIARIENDPNCFGLQVRLSDRFGDNGMISVVICRAQPGGDWDIDTWLMSCRVLGRGVETMVLRELLENARHRGVVKLRGSYFPTERNHLVADHYPKQGFTLIDSSRIDSSRIDSSRTDSARTDSARDGVTRWELDVRTAQPESAPMLIKRRALGDAARALACT